MDVLGKKGEDAVEGVQNLSGRVEDLESHLNALDNAVEEVREESREIDLEISKVNRERLIQIEDVVEQLLGIQEKNLEETSKYGKDVDRAQANINSLRKRIQGVIDNQNRLESKIDDIERKVFNLEEDLNQKIDLNEDRMETKVSQKEFENRNSDLKREISRLKASVNSLADDMDDDSIKVE